MSFDRSFLLESALERFFSRNPNLRSVPELAALSQKGGALTADEFAATIADPFLHPKYTISILGCFCPLARKIVLRATSKLQKVLNLDSESNESEEEVGDGDIYVIDFYVRRGRGLRLHELASLAFCQALDLAPYLLRKRATWKKKRDSSSSSDDDNEETCCYECGKRDHLRSNCPKLKSISKDKDKHKKKEKKKALKAIWGDSDTSSTSSSENEQALTTLCLMAHENDVVSDSDVCLRASIEEW